MSTQGDKVWTGVAIVLILMALMPVVAVIAVLAKVSNWGGGQGLILYICFQKKNKYMYKNTKVELVDKHRFLHSSTVK